MDSGAERLVKPVEKLLSILDLNSFEIKILQQLPDPKEETTMHNMWLALLEKYGHVTSDPVKIRLMHVISQTSISLRSLLSADGPKQKMVGFLNKEWLLTEPNHKTIPKTYFAERVGEAAMVSYFHLNYKVWMGMVSLICLDAGETPIPGIETTHDTPLGTRIVLAGNRP